MRIDQAFSSALDYIRNSVLLTAALFPMCAMGETPTQGVVMPPVTMTQGRQDLTAIQQISEFVKGIQTRSWVGMEGEGDYTPNAPGPSGSPSGPEPATLWMLGGSESRLDIQTATGVSSLRMKGGHGATQHEDGRIRQMDLRNAVAGLVAFPYLLTNGFPASNVSLIDQGTVIVNGTSLHRISMGWFWPGEPAAIHAQSPATVIDFYFDPETNLLALSATLAVGSSSEPARYLRVISYGDYRTIGGMILPYLYSESLNGQLLWTLQLKTIQLQPGLTDSGFTFSN